MTPKPPVNIMTPCLPLLMFDSNDVRDVIKVVIRNNNLYYECSEKMNSAIEFIKHYNN